jgi:hypothetical protein
MPNLFQLRRRRLTADEHRGVRDRAFQVWPDATGVVLAA